MELTWTMVVWIAYALYAVAIVGHWKTDEPRSQQLGHGVAIVIPLALIILANAVPSTKLVLVPGAVIALLFIGYNWERVK